jgi:hypothetical protein
MFNETWLLEQISIPRDKGLNLVNEMIKIGNYKFVREIALKKLGYQIDYFDPHVRMTLLHTIAKYRTLPWDE